MIWLNMASTLSGCCCWLGFRWCDWVDMAGVKMRHVEGREGENATSEYNGLSVRYIN
jgi:hypothetical protein